MPPMSPGDVVTNFIFYPGRWRPPTGGIREVTFRGVAFSKAIFSRLSFTNCKFEDCLFVGSRFREVEFHGCTFLNCNFWKAQFKHVYLDPRSIKLEERFEVEAANAGVSLFQALLSNFSDERQDEFYMLADIQFRRWKRHQLSSDLRRKRISPSAARWRHFASVAYEALAGFGYRPVRFFIWTLSLFIIVSAINYFLIGDAVQVGSNPVSHASFVDTVFYTFSILTVLGFSTVVPVTCYAKILTVLEALAAIGWLGIFTAILVKRFLR